MKTEYLPSFIKDLKKLKSNPIYPTIKTLVMADISNYETLTLINNLKKIKGDDNAYRIRVGDYHEGRYQVSGGRWQVEYSEIKVFSLMVGFKRYLLLPFYFSHKI